MIEGTVQVLIQHHPHRQRHLDLLLHSLDVDSVTEFGIVENSVNSAEGMRACFAAIRHPGYLVVLQDDILPCRDLLATCKRLIEARPDGVISLYSDNPAVSQAVAQGYAWVKLNVAWGLCGYILPTYLAASYLEVLPSLRSVYADDVMLSTFLKLIHQPVWLTAPSLVEHLGHETAQGFKHVKTRTANYFIGYEHSGLEVEWHRLSHLTITLESDTREVLRHELPAA